MKFKSFLAVSLMVVMGFACLTGIGKSLAHASTSEERESLRDLEGIVLNPINFTSTPTDLQPVLPLLALRDQVENEMRKAGIPLVQDGLAAVSGVPHLQIQGAVSQITANYFAYTIVIDVHQVATLAGKTEQRAFMVTWSEGLLSVGDIENFRNRLMFLTRLFIQDFQSVNTPSSHAWPLNWPPPSPSSSLGKSGHF